LSAHGGDESRRCIQRILQSAMSYALCFDNKFIRVILEWPAVKASCDFDLPESTFFK
jgi:hypothetical protein